MAADLSETNAFSYSMKENSMKSVNKSEQNRKSRIKSHLFGWKKIAKSKVIKKDSIIKLLRRRLPILNWIPTYNWNFAIHDLIAGLTVSLITIPQGIAYAAVAGLPLQVKNFIHPCVSDY